MFLYIIVEFLDSSSELSYSVMIQELVLLVMATIATCVLCVCVFFFFCVGFFPLVFEIFAFNICFMHFI